MRPQTEQELTKVLAGLRSSRPVLQDTILRGEFRRCSYCGDHWHRDRFACATGSRCRDCRTLVERQRHQAPPVVNPWEGLCGDGI